MCYTIEINLIREQLVKRFNASIDPETPFRKGQRINAFSLPECPIISTKNPDIIQLFTWGLIPAWCRDMEYAKEIRLKTFNAKAETLSEKASFRHLVKDHKCLVLTNGFYEWQARGKDKQPYYITVNDSEGIALAGLHDSWTNKETGEIINTFTIITTEANPMMARIHNTKKRMPVILDESDERAWLDPALTPDKSFSYLKAYDEKRMVAVEVDKNLFNKKKLDAVQKSLF
jgi:putative SOS response-associated peptidase YedK